MIKIEEINKLPDPIKKEVLDYAEYLISKYELNMKENKRNKWSDIYLRGSSIGETTSETITQMREEES